MVCTAAELFAQLLRDIITVFGTQRLTEPLELRSHALLGTGVSLVEEQPYLPEPALTPRSGLLLGGKFTAVIKLRMVPVEQQIDIAIVVCQTSLA